MLLPENRGGERGRLMKERNTIGQIPGTAKISNNDQIMSSTKYHDHLQLK